MTCIQYGIIVTGQPVAPVMAMTVTLSRNVRVLSASRRPRPCVPPYGRKYAITTTHKPYLRKDHAILQRPLITCICILRTADDEEKNVGVIGQLNRKLVIPELEGITQFPTYAPSYMLVPFLDHADFQKNRRSLKNMLSAAQQMQRETH